MVKIDFKDRVLQNPALTNRYTLNPVDGQANTYDVIPAQGTVTQEGTPVRALELNQIQTNTENAILGNLAAQIPTIAGSSTTRDLTVPAEANKNRLTILLSSAVTATSNIRLRVGTGAYYNLIWPKPGAAVNISSLLDNTPYDLIFNGSAWIVKDYVEYGNSGNNYWTKYSDGTMKQRGLWSGTFGITTSLATNIYYSGDQTITLPQTFINSNYTGGIALSSSDSEGTGAIYRTRAGSVLNTTVRNTLVFSFWSHSSQASRSFVIPWWAEGRWY